MRPVATLCAAALVGYTVALIALEWTSGAAAVGPYLEDPTPGRPFEAINTALSTGLLWVAAALFLGALRVGTTLGDPGWRERAFLVSQFAFFVGVGLDERFRLVSSLAARLDAPETLLYASVGGVELLALVSWGRVPRGPRLQTSFVLGAVAAYGMAGLGDLLLAPEFALRRTAEDLPKVWGGVCLVLFAWRRMMDRVDAAAPLWEPGAAFQLGRRAAGGDPDGWRTPDRPTPRLTELAHPAPVRPRTSVPADVEAGAPRNRSRRSPQPIDD